MLRKTLSILMVVTLLSGAFVFAPAGVETAQAAPNASSVVYNIFATDGYMNMADHDVSNPDPLLQTNSRTYIYGFIGGRSTENLVYYDPTTKLAVNTGAPAPAPTGGARTPTEEALAGQAQLPGPAIYAKVGDVVEIRLKNLGIKANTIAPNDPHSIHLHGLDVDAANDGVPETSVGAVPANLCANGTSDVIGPEYNCETQGGLAPGAGNVIVYMFSAETPATSMWHCHQEADIHVQMGMYGALVIYDTNDPAGNANSTFCTSGLLNGKACGKGPGSGVGGVYNGFYYDKDVLMLLSEVDQSFHHSEGGTYDVFAGVAVFTDTVGVSHTVGTAGIPVVWNPIDYHPQYWLVNGLSFPNTIGVSNQAINVTEWKKAYPAYDPLLTGSVGTTTNWAYTQQWNKVSQPGEKILLRMINMGYEAQPMHIHGYHLKMLGSDQRPWPWGNRVLWGKPTPFGQGLEKNTILIGSGETYETLLDMGQQSFQATYADGSGVIAPFLGGDFAGGTQTRYWDGTPACSANLTALGLTVPITTTPVSNEATACPTIPDAGALGAPDYIGGPTVTGAVGIPMTNQVFPFHNHDDYKATNNGAYPGGQFTAVIPTP